MTEAFRYSFAADVPAEDVEGALLLAILGAESLHGEAQVRLDAGHAFDAGRRVLVLDAGTAAGRDVNKLFVHFLSREFGPEAFKVERVGTDVPAKRQEMHS